MQAATTLGFFCVAMPFSSSSWTISYFSISTYISATWMASSFVLALGAPRHLATRPLTTSPAVLHTFQFRFLDLLRWNRDHGEHYPLLNTNNFKLNCYEENSQMNDIQGVGKQSLKSIHDEFLVLQLITSVE